MRQLAAALVLLCLSACGGEREASSERLEGTVQRDSIEFSEEECAWRFVVETGEGVRTVIHEQCVVPDAFADGAEVRLVGVPQADGTLLAETLLTSPLCTYGRELPERHVRPWSRR